ncbi:uncharacterized protein LOC134183411 isoform X2 [Corticium candelabrum]|uniref:uncharacterized protein LOC134183411 isoform X2 n=1 Tax=Corticium candelabrum TaxID=121492 RepID=UPI002E2663C0|nr:uncharacterized protein LOC134183411 isoform X2 [Corticium candelabrum]
MMTCREGFIVERLTSRFERIQVAHERQQTEVSGGDVIMLEGSVESDMTLIAKNNALETVVDKLFKHCMKNTCAKHRFECKLQAMEKAMKDNIMAVPTAVQTLVDVQQETIPNLIRQRACHQPARLQQQTDECTTEPDEKKELVKMAAEQMQIKEENSTLTRRNADLIEALRALFVVNGKNQEILQVETPPSNSAARAPNESEFDLPKSSEKKVENGDLVDETRALKAENVRLRAEIMHLDTKKRDMTQQYENELSLGRKNEERLRIEIQKLQRQLRIRDYSSDKKVPDSGLPSTDYPVKNNKES